MGKKRKGDALDSPASMPGSAQREAEPQQEERRAFIKTGLVTGGLGLLAMSLPGLSLSGCTEPPPLNPVTKRSPQTALVVWFSQTGHTRRIGRIIQNAWEKAGLKVTGGDYRQLDPRALAQVDLIAFGSPINYMGVPKNLRDWMDGLPPLKGTSVAAYVTYGGKGDGQHNTACQILERLTQRGGAAVGKSLFGNMSTFAPTWSLGNEERTLAFKDRPNEATYRQARQFAAGVLANVAAGKNVVIDYQWSLSSLIPSGLSVGATKLMMSQHHIDTSRCVSCGTCAANCPVGAITLQNGRVDDERCIACFACINNCPAGAMKMDFLHKPVYGFRELLTRNRIEIREPQELSG